MRALLSLAMWLVVLVPVGCDPSTAPRQTMEYPGDPEESEVVLADYLVPVEELLDEGQDPLDERARAIESIRELAPDLASDADFMASLRGEPGSYVILALPEERKELAPLIARVYQLSERERAIRRGTDTESR